MLSTLESPLVLVLNEVDCVFEYPEIAGDFLPLIRSWHEQAKRMEIWQKLRLVLVYSTEIIVPLKLTQSPFNIGLPIKLLPFTKEQVQDLAQRHGLDWTDGKDAESLMAMVGGHPYLVRLALYHLMGKGGLERDLQQLLQQAPTEAGIYNEYLRRYLLKLREQPKLGDAFYQVINATYHVKIEPGLAYKLQSLGLINMQDAGSTPACELYRLYFREQLKITEDFSNASVERLKQENQQLRVLSSLDELTQLANRHYFHTYLQIEWQRAARDSATQRLREHIPISLILCDVDYFKIYNKTYGNSAGDECLRQIADTICNCVNCPLGSSSLLYASRSVTYSAINTFAISQTTNSGDESSSVVLVARYGDEEFAILVDADITVCYAYCRTYSRASKSFGD